MSNHRSWASNVGVEEGVEQLGGSAIVAPSSEVLTFNSAPGDELVAYRCELVETRPCQEGVFASAQHRCSERYGAIAGQSAVVPPE